MGATEDRQRKGFTDFLAYRSIQLWMDVVNKMYHLSEEEWRGRLQVVRQFCEAEGKDPDEIIAEARSDRAGPAAHGRAGQARRQGRWRSCARNGRRSRRRP